MGAVDALAMKYGADTRPGFDERRPLKTTRVTLHNPGASPA